jgi:hypothetical protein
MKAGSKSPIVAYTSFPLLGNRVLSGKRVKSNNNESDKT